MSLKRQRGESSPTFDNSLIGFFGCNGGGSFAEDTIRELEDEGDPSFTRGAFGEVSIGIEKRELDGRCNFVAIKTISQALVVSTGHSFGQPQAPPKLSREVFNELCALRHLSSHPNIASLRAWYPARSSHVPKTSLCLVFSYAPTDLHVSLEWRRRACMSPLGLDVIKAVAKDLLSALSHCHALGVLHRDVKPGNLLLLPNGIIQLCDFGLAKPFLDENQKLIEPSKGESGTKGLCTLFYRPPEVLLGGQSAEPGVDLYSAGLVLAELILGRPLLAGSNVMEQLSLIFQQFGTPSETLWPNARHLPDFGKVEFASHQPVALQTTILRLSECPSLVDLLESLLSIDPLLRLSAKKALGHNCFSEQAIPRISDRHTLCRALIPPRLQVPPLLDPSNEQIARNLAIRMADKRRRFFSSLSLWTGPEIVPKAPEQLLTHWKN